MLQSLTSVFGMRTGVSPELDHQIRSFYTSICFILYIETKLISCMPEQIVFALGQVRTRLCCRTNYSKQKRRSTFPTGTRPISTPWLNTLLCVHLVPINLIISQGTTIPHLRTGFPLRCFQRLSIPNIATLQCHGRDSRQTRGSFIRVLSY